VIRQLFLQPPLAFARLGRSDTPADAYSWGASDLSPRGSALTTLQRELTLDVASDGTLSVRSGTNVELSDAAGIRPVCPFFELWCERQSTDAGGATQPEPVTLTVLREETLELSDVEWSVNVANLKAFHMTRACGDRVEASLAVRGDRHECQPLLGRSPPDVEHPLVHATPLPLGMVQLTRPAAAASTQGGLNADVLRLRFTPPKGYVYGPEDLANRQSRSARPYDAVPILNPAAVWCGWMPAGADPDWRTTPQGQYAREEPLDETARGLPRSLGLLDDVCDGIIGCHVRRLNLHAVARIVVTPPDYAPDRRPITSSADGLFDRNAKDLAAVVSWADSPDPDTEAEILDLFERVAETFGAINLDHENERLKSFNQLAADAQGRLRDHAPQSPFTAPLALPGFPLPLTHVGSLRHRRLLALDYLIERFREQPQFLDALIRPPWDTSPFYDARMPALMRGSDLRPLRLSRFQYERLSHWIQSLPRRGPIER